jgi:general secretion pathway protein K
MIGRIASKGFILITVLLVIVLMTGLLLAFNRTARASLGLINEDLRRSEALNGARSGLHLVMSALAGGSDLQNQPQWRDAFIKEKAVNFGNKLCTLRIRLENGKINVNHLLGANGQLDRPRVDQLLQLIDLLNAQSDNDRRIGYGLAPALVDWLDPDDQPTHFDFVSRDNRGAERNYYMRQKPAYSCSNAPLSFVEQLLWVKGMSREAYHGNQTMPGLKEFLTVYGNGKVDINTADPLVLQSLSSAIDPVIAQRIVKQRQIEPFTSVAELQSYAGLSPSAAQQLSHWVTVSPDNAYYTIRSTVVAGPIEQTISATLKHNVGSRTVEIVMYRELEKIPSE